MSKSNNHQIKISCENIWKIFGSNPQVALARIRGGMTKQELLEQANHVVAVQNASFNVIEGEIFMVMGLSGSGKSTLARCINGFS